MEMHGCLMVRCERQHQRTSDMPRYSVFGQHHHPIHWHPQIARLTCHFKQLGLKLGRPTPAASCVVYTCSVCSRRRSKDGALTGKSLLGQVTSGNLSNTRFTDGGMVKMLAGF